MIRVLSAVAAAVLAAAALSACDGGFRIIADHEGGVVRYSRASNEHAKALLTAETHCQHQGFTTYTITHEYNEGDLGGVDFKCRN